jgi:SAM-dependent methyltransferase
MNENPLPNLSYLGNNSLEESLEKIQKKIIATWAFEEQAKRLELMEGLTHFPLGRFLLQHQALNGEWLHYVSTFPFTAHSEYALENLILTQCPTIKAMQQRLRSFCKILQKNLFDGIRLCSLPCGWMSELLLVNYQNVKDICITGIDLDPLALQEASKFAKNLPEQIDIRLLLANAWEITNKNEFDVMTSNGLNIYEKDEKRLCEFYQKLLFALKPGGVLLTSFLTHPPGVFSLNEWRLDKVNLQTLAFERMLFGDILQVRWQNYYTSDGFIALLKSVGFVDIQIVPDDARIYPTVIARKPVGPNDKLAKFWEELSIKRQGRDSTVIPPRRKHRRGAPFCP